ncbi:DUF2062 domain-containing protein [Candidatus Persebacteraceae bacterium Df01]|jgi:uncharacterized protein (DUF2062 family)|uniref:DUF2062 domain-containing protein n=1 Tax=Candidatus Doriopsillibacter californiensis TaxID=2970740 RepID=A0ABT7QLB2_9GAMM|nr:DUF2062 domain-containing protein [Candidatus Persebacteraceae bacterium Df01]
MFFSRSFFRSLRYRIRQNERLLILKVRAAPYSLLAKMAAAKTLAFDAQSISRGLAVGMFWCFVPIPLQMFPAMFFCWLGRANIPVAIISVWISNPLTYVPIFYFEYQIGQWLLDSDADSVTWDGFSHYLQDGDVWSSSWEFLSHIIHPLMQGAIVLSTFMAIIGYVSGLLLFRFLAKKKSHATNPR